MTPATASLRRTFLRGILLILPLAITFALLGWLFRLITGSTSPLVERLLAALGSPVSQDPWLRFLTPVIAIALTIGVVLIVGFVGGHYVGRRALAWFEQLLLRLPLVKWIYGASRQLMDAFSATGSGAFREVVFVEYPRRGVWCLGFVTAPAGGRFPGVSSGDSVFVFLPTTPNPTSGYTVIVDRSEVVPAVMTVEEGLKLIVSGGFIAPPSGRGSGA